MKDWVGRWRWCAGPGRTAAPAGTAVCSAARRLRCTRTTAQNSPELYGGLAVNVGIPHWGNPHCTAKCHKVSQCVMKCYKVLQSAAVCCSVCQCVYRLPSSLQYFHRQPTEYGVLVLQARPDPILSHYAPLATIDCGRTRCLMRKQVNTLLIS